MGFYGLLFFLTLIPRPQQQLALKKVWTPQLGLLVVTGLVILTLEPGVGLRRMASCTSPLLDEEGTVLIQTPAGNTVLIGGGKRPSTLNPSGWVKCSRQGMESWIFW